MTETTLRNGERRPRNPRGQGARLRDEIVEAATAILAETGSAPDISLRGVAKRVGVAATSIYLHYPDVESLASAVAARAFGQFSAELAAAVPPNADPAQTLLARCRAYCHFALAHSGLYRVMFDAPRPDLAPSAPYSLGESPGGAAFARLAAGLERCQDAGLIPAGGDPVRLAVMVWSTLHGLVSLRISRPRFPWPPLDELVDETIGRLVGLQQSSQVATGRDCEDDENVTSDAFRQT